MESRQREKPRNRPGFKNKLAEEHVSRSKTIFKGVLQNKKKHCENRKESALFDFFVSVVEIQLFFPAFNYCVADISAIPSTDQVGESNRIFSFFIGSKRRHQKKTL